MKVSRKTMSHWDHLEELRLTLAKIGAVLIVATLVGLQFADMALSILIAPLDCLLVSGKVVLAQTGPFDAVLIVLKVSLLIGLLMSFPLILFLLWQFIAPALRRGERRLAWWLITSMSLLFALGVFSSWKALEVMMPAVCEWKIDNTSNYWNVKGYVDFAVYWMLVGGIVFETPVAVVALVRLGLVDAAALRKGRPYAVVSIFVLAAVITPSPDAFTQLVVGAPMCLLYEAGILVSRFFKPK